MASQGPLYAGAVGTNSWTNPSYAVGSGETTCATTAAILNGFWNTFGFSLPVGAIVEGIVVETKVSKTVTQAASVTLVVGKNEATLGTEEAAQTLTNVACGASQPILSWGSSTYLWGLSWTRAEVNAASFCVRVTSVQARAKALNWIRVTIYYHIQTDVSVSEPMGSISDSVSYVLQRDRAPSEAIGAVSDVVEKIITRIQNISEPSISASDIVSAEKFIPLTERSVNEPIISISDAISYLLQRAIAVNEPSVSVLDDATYLLTRVVDISEPPISALDTADLSVRRVRDASEPPISISDMVSYILQRAVNVNEPPIAVGDIASYILYRSLVVNELPISITDFVLAEKITPTVVVERAILEALGLVFDSTITEEFGSVFERFVLENMGLLVDQVSTEVYPSMKPKVRRVVFTPLWYVKHSTKKRLTRSGSLIS